MLEIEGFDVNFDWLIDFDFFGLTEFLFGLLMSAIGSFYYAAYSLVYGYYHIMYDLIQPLINSFCDVLQIVINPILLSTVILGALPVEVAILMIALCTCKICILFARLVLRIIGSIPTLSGGWFDFR